MAPPIFKHNYKISKKNMGDVYRSGEKIISPSLSLLWQFKKNPTHPIISTIISIPKRNIKKAVDRNYIKRQIKNIYRNNTQIIDTKMKDPINIIFTYNKSGLTQFNKLEKEVLFLMKKINENN